MRDLFALWSAARLPPSITTADRLQYSSLAPSSGHGPTASTKPHWDRLH